MRSEMFREIEENRKRFIYELMGMVENQSDNLEETDLPPLKHDKPILHEVGHEKSCKLPKHRKLTLKIFRHLSHLFFI